MPFAWFAGERTSPVLCYFIIWGFVFFFLFLIGCGIFLSEMNASFSLPQVPLVEPGAVLASLMELDLAGMLCAIKELPFPLSSFLFSAAETMTLACLYCLAREAWKFLCIFVDENLCKKKNTILWFLVTLWREKSVLQSSARLRESQAFWHAGLQEA